MIEPIIEFINACADEELARANTEHPQFRSKHEAYGVLAEELHEAETEYNLLKENEKRIELETFNDYSDEEMKRALKDLRSSAICCASELVQVIAMCDKWSAMYD